MRSAVMLLAAPAIVLSPAGTGGEPPAAVVDSRSAPVVFDDLDRFAAVFSRLAGSSRDRRLLEEGYLAPASEGLRVYSELYGVDAEALLGAIERHRAAYEVVSNLGPTAVRSVEPGVRRAAARLEELYPPAIFPPTYFLVGPMRAGGAVQKEGVLIAVETYATDAPDYALHRFERLPHLVIHELVHYQQAAWNPDLYQASTSLLARAIKEGVADFVTELVSGSHTNTSNHEYGLRHERHLWKRFREEMHGTSTGEWFFTDPADSTMPRDLGYFVGYRIARSRYEREPDPGAAIAALLRVADYPRFLAESGYEESLRRAGDGDELESE